MKISTPLFLSALFVPLTQTVIWICGVMLNRDLYNQLSGSGREDWTPVVIILGAIVQCIIMAVLGFVATLAYNLPAHICRLTLLIEGVVGAVCFLWLLKDNWIFDYTNCSRSIDSGCDFTSPQVFDFTTSVFLGLPLIWCLGLIFVAFFRTPTKALPSN